MTEKLSTRSQRVFRACLPMQPARATLRQSQNLWKLYTYDEMQPARATLRQSAWCNLSLTSVHDAAREGHAEAKDCPDFLYHGGSKDAARQGYDGISERKTARPLGGLAVLLPLWGHSISTVAGGLLVTS